MPKATPPLPEPLPLPPPQPCRHYYAGGCQAAAITSDWCLAHLPPDERSSYLASLTAGANLDFRGTTFTRELLREVLDAIRTAGLGRLGVVDFSRATFESPFTLADLHIEGIARFDYASFGEPATFVRVRFAGGVSFAGSSFEGEVNFIRVRLGVPGAQPDDQRIDLSFREARFAADAILPGLDATGRIDLAGADFRGVLILSGGRLRGGVDFTDAHFEGDVILRDVAYSSDLSDYLDWRLTPAGLDVATRAHHRIERLRNERPRAARFLRSGGIEFQGHQVLEGASERQAERAERRERAAAAHRAVRRLKVVEVALLALLSVTGLAVAYVAGHGALDQGRSAQFEPSETGQIIAAIGGLATALGAGGAAVIKAIALLIHARADIIRARAGLPAESAAEITGEQGGDPAAEQA